MGVGAGLYVYDVVVKKFTFAIPSLDEFLLWPPYVIGGPLYFCPVVSFLLLLSFSSPNLSGRRSDVCHTSTHGVAVVRI